MGAFEAMRASLSPEELAKPATRDDVLRSMSVTLEEMKTLKARLDLTALDFKALNERVTKLEELADHASAPAASESGK